MLTNAAIYSGKSWIQCTEIGNNQIRSGKDPNPSIITLKDADMLGNVKSGALQAPQQPQALLQVCQRYLSLPSRTRSLNITPLGRLHTVSNRNSLGVVRQPNFPHLSDFSSADSAECWWPESLSMPKVQTLQIDERQRFQHKIRMRKYFTFVMKFSVALRYLKILC